MHVSAIYLFPVKSLGGIAVTEAQVDPLGFEGDRRFLVIDAAGTFMTQRSHPQMALIRTGLAGDLLTLSHARAGTISVPRRVPPGSGVLRTVAVWKSEGLQAEDCGDAVADWLAEALGERCRMVRIGDQFHRPVLKPTAQPGDLTSFSDAFPFMTISEASLSDLNARLTDTNATPVAMNRFRPNIVIAGAAAYEEDEWPRVRIGEVVFRSGGPCARCIMTTVDQETGIGGKEPLRLLATYRRDANDRTRINFGQNLLHETKTGRIRVGDPVVPLPARFGGAEGG